MSAAETAGWGPRAIAAIAAARKAMHTAVATARRAAEGEWRDIENYRTYASYVEDHPWCSKERHYVHAERAEALVPAAKRASDHLARTEAAEEEVRQIASAIEWAVVEQDADTVRALIDEASAICAKWGAS